MASVRHEVPENSETASPESDSLERLGGPAHHHSPRLRPVGEEGSNLSRRCNRRLTPVARHLPPFAVAIPRSFNSRAMAVMDRTAAVQSSRIVERKTSARMSAACLFAFPWLTVPIPDVASPKYISTRTTVV